MQLPAPPPKDNGHWTDFFCLYSKTMHAESLADFWRLSKWCRERMFFFFNDSLLGSFFFPTLFPLQLWPTLFLVSHGKTQAPRNVTVGLRFISWAGVTYVLLVQMLLKKKDKGVVVLATAHIYFMTTSRTAEQDAVHLTHPMPTRREANVQSKAGAEARA